MHNKLAKARKWISLSVTFALLTLCLTACSDRLNSSDGTVHQQEVASAETLTDADAELWFEASEEDDRVALNIGKKSIKVEYADSPQSRQLGLMFRRELCQDCGMLFKFSQARIGSIWMKNTFIPLDLAYITKQGLIVDIRPLQPHDLNPVKSSSEVLYALEMNQGWFAKQDIRVGDTVSLLP